MARSVAHGYHGAMPTHQVLVTDHAWPSLEIEAQVLSEVGAELIVAKQGDEEELLSLAPEVDAILTCWKPVTQAVLERATRCVIVSRYGVGLDNIAVEDATRLGMIVTNVPDFCLEEVSDHAMALLLGCARRIGLFARATRSGRWNLDEGRPIHRLRGQTLGLVGFGNTARALVPKAQGFGLKVIAYSPRLDPEACEALGVEPCGWDELLERADYLSLHVPLTSETRHLIDARTLRAMRATAYLINTSRGAVIDEQSLHQALTDGSIAGAGLDVLAEEPPPPDHPLLALDNVVATPHAAFYSVAAIEELERSAAQNVAAVLRGELPKNVINRNVVEQVNCRLQQ
jgi:D-3-phosphoglycerate dehydrogenase